MSYGGGNSFGPNAGKVGNGNVTKSGVITVNAKLADRFYHGERLKTHPIFPGGDIAAGIGNVEPFEVLFTTGLMRTSDRRAMGHAALVGSSLAGMGHDAKVAANELYPNDPKKQNEVATEMLLDTIIPLGQAQAGAEMSPGIYNTESKYMAMQVAGIGTFPATTDMRPGQKLVIDVHIPNQSTNWHRPSGIPANKPILKLVPEVLGRHLAATLRRNLDLFADTNVQDFYKKHMGARATANRAHAIAKIEDALLYAVALGFQIANKGISDAGDAKIFARRLKIGGAKVPDGDESERQKVLNALFDREQALKGDYGLGVDNGATNNNYDTMDTDSDGVVFNQKFAIAHLLDGVQALVEANENRKFGTVMRGDQKGGTVDVLF